MSTRQQRVTDERKPKRQKYQSDDNAIVQHEAVVVPPTKEGTVEDFESLRKECLREGRLYEDPNFPAKWSSLYYSDDKAAQFGYKVDWKRPREICDNPKLFLDGPTRFDIVLGSVGNCWFIASLATLTLNTKALHQVVPKGQDFRDKYAGIFHIRFWHYGRWITIIVDDRLPTREGKLIFLTSSQSNEFWSALVEKAYAKLYGSYETIAGGWQGEGFEDLTGGLSEVLKIDDLRDKPAQLFRRLMQSYKRGSFMGCDIMNYIDDESSDKGLVAGHAYSITCVRYVEAKTPTGIQKMRMVRVRNPWGDATEWSGAWSDESSEWGKVSDDVKEKLDLKDRDDGEYWMEIKDFCKHFNILEFTHLNPESTRDYLTENTWEMKQFEGTWTKGISSGGCILCSDTFHLNRQYRITLNEHDDVLEGDEDDDDDEDSTSDGSHKCTMIVSLMKKNMRSMKKDNKSSLYIGFSIFKIPDPENAPQYLGKSFFKENKEISQRPYIYYQRTYTQRFQLDPGTYCVVPTTISHYDEGDFFLRIFTEKHQASQARQQTKKISYNNK